MAPDASEFVYEVYTIADHFTFTQRPGDAFVFTTTHAHWVNLELQPDDFLAVYAYAAELAAGTEVFGG